MMGKMVKNMIYFVVLLAEKKFYEFYTAPITKFWADSVSGGNYYRAG